MTQLLNFFQYARVGLLSVFFGTFVIFLGVALAVDPPPAPAPTIPPIAQVVAPTNTAGPRVRFQDDIVRLVGHGKVVGFADLVVDQPTPADCVIKLGEIVDDTRPPGTDTSVKFETSEGALLKLQRSASLCRWRVPISVVGLDINSQQTRYATVIVGGVKSVVTYVLTNRTATPAEFSVVIRPQWAVDSNRRATALVIEARDQPVSGLRIAMSTLTEQSVGTPIEIQALELCAEEKGACSLPEVIPAQRSSSLFLRMKDEDRPNGSYKGMVYLASDSRPEAKAFSIDVLSTSTCAHFVGGALILFGVALAWCVNVYLRARSSRLSALLVATIAKEKMETLSADVSKVKQAMGVNLDDLNNWMQTEILNLTEQHLDSVNALPSKLAAFYKPFDDSQFKLAMTKADTNITIFSTLVHDGLDVLLARWEKNLPAPTRPAIKSAAESLNKPSLHDDAEARALVNAALASTNPPAAALGDSASQLTQRTSEQLAVRIQRVDAFAWIVYAILFTLAGIIVLILRAPGFGTPIDLIYCLFWGFGLPIATDKLSQLTPSTLATTFGITLPK